MPTYDFTLVLGGSPELTDEVADRLFEAGCDDGSPGSCNGVVSIDFHRSGSSLQGAIASAMRDVQTAGFAVERVMIDAASFPSMAAAELPATPPIYRFSIVELMAAVTAIAVGLSFPVILPCVAVLLLIRLGLGLLESVFLAILAALTVIWFWPV